MVKLLRRLLEEHLGQTDGRPVELNLEEAKSLVVMVT